MDWNYIIATIVGGLIALVPIIVTNHFQSKERDKDRIEKRRDTKIESIEKSMGSDIDKTMDMIASLIKVMSEYENYEYKKAMLDLRKNAVVISEDEYKQELNSHIKLFTTQTEDIITLTDSISGFIYSFDDEISSIFDNLKNSLNSYINSEQLNNEGSGGWEEVMRSAGNLQRMLREKKISIQDSVN